MSNREECYSSNSVISVHLEYCAEMKKDNALGIEEIDHIGQPHDQVVVNIQSTWIRPILHGLL